MDHELIVPEELRNLFRRLLQHAPEALREDASLHRMMLVYLKVGGENLVRQHIEIARLRHEDKNKVPQHPLERICPDDVDMEEDNHADDPDFE